MKTRTNRRTSFPLRNFPISRFPFHIATILSLILLIIVACTSSTESPKGNLSGTVSLEGQEDFSEITVELYDLAYLDTTIVRINNEYPHIGVIINQHTEFDHRFQSPLYQTSTSADGSFSLKDIPTGKYNFVAQKDGFGFRYITDMEISKGENHLVEQGKREMGNPVKYTSYFTGQEGKKVVTLSYSENLRNSIEGQTSSPFSHLTSHDAKHRSPSSDFSPFTSPISQIELDNSIDNLRSDLTLYPETVYSGNYDGEHIFETNHHYIIEEHTSFVPGSRLEIQPGAIVRINPGKNLNIYGNLKAQGEMNNMFWITSNDGFIAEGKKDVTLSDSENFRNSIEGETSSNSRSEASNSLFPSPISHRSDEIELYNSMSIESTATIEDDLIEWGKWGLGNKTLQMELQIGNNIESSIFAGQNSGLYMISCDDNSLKKNVVKNSNNDSFGGIYFSTSLNNNVSKNIILYNVTGIRIHQSNDTNIHDNYLAYCAKGIINLIYSENTLVEYNEFLEHESAIENIGASTIYVFYNNITADIGINNTIQASHGSNSYPYINNNNLYCSIYAVRTRAILYVEPRILDAKYNWWNTTSTDEIDELIWDKNDIEPTDSNYQYYGNFEYVPYKNQKINDAGIQ